MYGKGIRNHMFWYQIKSKTIFINKFLPRKDASIFVDEDIEEAFFYEIDDNSFWVIINHKFLYKCEHLVRKAKYDLPHGNQYEEIFIDGKFYSDYSGDEISIYDTETKQSYSLKLLNQTYYDIVSKDFIVIDFNHSEKVLDNFLPNNEMKSIEKKNVLCRMNLISGTENKISLEFVSFLPSDLNIQKINPKLGLFFSRSDETKTVSVYKNTRCLCKVDLPDLDDAVNVQPIDDEKIAVEYEKEIVFIDISSGKMSYRIDMTQKIKLLKECATFDKVGDYYDIYVNTNRKEDDEPWRAYVCDQNLNPIYEIEDRRHFFFTD